MSTRFDPDARAAKQIQLRSTRRSVSFVWDANRNRRFDDDVGATTSRIRHRAREDTSGNTRQRAPGPSHAHGLRLRHPRRGCALRLGRRSARSVRARGRVADLHVGTGIFRGNAEAGRRRLRTHARGGRVRIRAQPARRRARARGAQRLPNVARREACTATTRPTPRCATRVVGSPRNPASTPTDSVDPQGRARDRRRADVNLGRGVRTRRRTGRTLRACPARRRERVAREGDEKARGGARRTDGRSSVRRVLVAAFAAQIDPDIPRTFPENPRHHGGASGGGGRAAVRNVLLAYAAEHPQTATARA